MSSALLNIVAPALRAFGPERLTTQHQHALYNALLKLSAGQCEIVCKPEYGDVCEILWHGDARRLVRSIVDFVICRRHDSLPVFAVELSDSPSPLVIGTKKFTGGSTHRTFSLPLLRVSTSAPCTLAEFSSALSDCWDRGQKIA